MVWKNRFLFFLAFGYALFCSTAPAAAQGGSDPVIIGYPSRSMTELPNHIALKKGFYRDEGLEVELVQARSNILVAALASNSIQYITSVNSSIGGIISGVPAKVIAIVTKNNPDFLMAKPEIRSIKELQGKTLAVSAFGGSSHQRLLIILEKAGLDPKADVSILSVGEARLRLEQLRLGAIDATVLTAPHNFLAERAGFRTLGSSKDILALPAVGLAALEKRIKEKPDQVRKVLRGVLKAMAYMQRNRDEVVQQAVAWLSLDKDLAERSYDAMAPNYAYDGTIDKETFKEFVELIVKRAGTSARKKLSAADVADFSLVEKARKTVGR